MELKPGSKQTEAGAIPKGWQVNRLGDIASVTAGGTPSRNNPRHWNGRIPWITTSQVGFNTITDAEQFITEDGLRSSAAKLFPPGTLLMALYGQGKTRGKVGVLGIDAATNQACAAIALYGGVCREYVFHFLASQYDAIRSLSNTGNQENLSGLIVRSIQLLMPPEPEQRAIAAALGDVDALLGALEKLIAKKRDLKQAAMQRLLTPPTAGQAGRQRLPGFRGEWAVKQLGEVTEIVSGGTPRTSVSSYWDGGVKWCTPTDITGTAGKYLFETERMISQAGLASCSAQLLPAGALLLCSRATIGELKIAACEVCTNQGFKSLIAHKGVNNEFLYYLLLSMKPQMVEKAIGSTFLEISKKDTASLEVRLPSAEDEQAGIAAVLSDMDAEIAALEQRRDKTRALKQGMMQELLTGRIRLV